MWFLQIKLMISTLPLKGIILSKMILLNFEKYTFQCKNLCIFLPTFLFLCVYCYICQHNFAPFFDKCEF